MSSVIAFREQVLKLYREVRYYYGNTARSNPARKHLCVHILSPRNDKIAPRSIGGDETWLSLGVKYASSVANRDTSYYSQSENLRAVFGDVHCTGI
eukprot:IDg13423t1